jgi:hypothetical protein
MTQPTKYVQLNDFSDELTTTAVPGTHGLHLDQDLQLVKAATDQIINNLALIQRDDTALKNGSVHPDSLSTATKALIGAGSTGNLNWTPRGFWLTATAYARGDVIETGGVSYVCATAHTSAALFSTDYAAGKWVTIDSNVRRAVPTLAGLNGLTGMSTGDIVFVGGYYTVGDGGHAYYRWSGSAWLMLWATEINVRQFGAKLNGVFDDTAACQAARLYAQNAQVAGNSGIYGVGAYVGSGPTTVWPPGLCYLNGPVTPESPSSVGYIKFLGHGTILRLAPLTVGFGGVGYDTTIENFKFRDGAIGIDVNTNNVDSSIVNVLDCHFHTQTLASLRATVSGGGTQLNVERPKFMHLDETLSGYLGYFNVIDVVNITDMWAHAYGLVPAFYINGALHVKGGRGVPGALLPAWFENHYELHVSGFNDGGENGGSKMFINKADLDTSNPIAPTIVSITDCWVLAGAQYIGTFDKLPNVFEFTRNRGLIDTLGFEFAAGLTTLDFFNWQKYGQIDVDQNYIQAVGQIANLTNISANGTLGLKVMRTAMARREGGMDGALTPRRERLKIAEVLGRGGIASFVTWTSALVGMTQAIVADTNGLSGAEYTATIDNGSFNVTLATYLNYAALTYGSEYTLRVLVESNATRGEIEVAIGGAAKKVTLKKNRQMILVPFVYFNGAGAPSAFFDKLDIYGYGTLNGEKVWIRSIDLLDGICNYDKETLAVESTVSPIAFTNGIGDNIGYIKGDRCELTNVVAGGNAGFVCTVAGEPGTWAPVLGSVIEGSASYNPPDLADGVGDTTTVTATGAALGDFVDAVSFGLDLQGVQLHGWVSAADTVSVRFQNETGGSVNLAGDTIRVRVRKA